jgi:hypothetical protein
MPAVKIIVLFVFRWMCSIIALVTTFSAIRSVSQTNDCERGPTEFSILLIEGVHIGARALLDI